jgi:hypothetical protein
VYPIFTYLTKELELELIIATIRPIAIEKTIETNETRIV